MIVNVRVSGSHSVNTAQGAVMFHRVTHRVLNIQPVVKPNDKWSLDPLHNATQGAAASVCEQQLRGESEQEVVTSVVTRRDVRETQQADEAVRSL